MLFHVINTQRTEFSFPAKMPDYFEINTSINIVGSYKIVFSVRTEFQRTLQSLSASIVTSASVKIP